MIIKNILSSNRSFAFALRSGPNAVPSRHRHGPLRGSVVVFLLLDLIAGTPAHYPGGAIETSRPTAITPHRRAPLRAPRAGPVVRSHRAHYGPVPLRGLIAMRSRRGRARCPHRAAAPPARCEAWHPTRLSGLPNWLSGLPTRLFKKTRAAEQVDRPRRKNTGNLLDSLRTRIRRNRKLRRSWR